MTDALPYWFDAALFAALTLAIIQLSTLGAAMSNQQATVDALTAQVGKIGDEVRTAHAVLVAELADVKAQLAAADAAEKVDLTGLAAAIQNVDDINPDADPVDDAVVDDIVEDNPAV